MKELPLAKERDRLSDLVTDVETHPPMMITVEHASG